MSSFNKSTTERVFSEVMTDLAPSKEVRFIVAFSGGCDSLALLVLCTRVLGAERIIPVYVNHNLRPPEELASEIKLNTENCRRLGLELVVRTLDEGAVQSLAKARRGGIEDAARAMRYALLEEERSHRACDFILTAHHMDDQVETILMRLSKGSPVTSLQGIRKVDSRRCIMRPLLGLRRSELESYLKDLGFEWSTDSTNSDALFERNRIRNEVLPQIKAIMPSIDKTIVSIGQEAAMLFGKHGFQDLGQSMEISDLTGMDASGRTFALYSMWDGLFPDKALPLTLVDRVLNALSEGRDCTIGANGALFVMHHGQLHLLDPSMDSLFSSFEVPVNRTENHVELPGGMVFSSGEAAIGRCTDVGKAIAIDPALMGSDVILRFVREGDRIRLKDGSKMVKRLLQDMGIPAQMRCRVPVLADGDGIIAVFAAVYGGRDRLSAKFRTSLARNGFPLYIVDKG